MQNDPNRITRDLSERFGRVVHRLLSHSDGTNLHHSAYISIGKADVLYGYADKGCQEAAGRLASELDKLEQAYPFTASGYGVPARGGAHA